MSYESFLNENFLLPIKATRNWLIVKNYLYNVDLKWLNSLDENDKFDVVDAYFYANIFYAANETEIKSVKYKIILDVYIIPKIENDVYVGFEYELSINLANSSEKNKILDFIEFEVENIFNLLELINIFLPFLSLNLNEIIQNETYQVSNFLEDLVRKSNLGKNIKRLIF